MEAAQLLEAAPAESASPGAQLYRSVRPAPPSRNISLKTRLLPLYLWLRNAAMFQPWKEVGSYELAPRAIFFLSPENLVRKQFIRLVRWKLFDWFFLSVILANCVTLAMASSKPGFEESSMGHSLKLSNYVFIALFTLEALCKIIALGFVLAQHTYLRNGWNMLDFTVVCMGLLELTSFGNYTFIRCFRVLRPLRAITKIEELKVIVSALVRSLPMLGDVVILSLFFFSIFGITCVELFHGALAYRCGNADFSTARVDDQGYIQNISYIVDATAATGQATVVCKGPMAGDETWSLSSSGQPSVSAFDYIGGRNWGYACQWQPTNNPNYPNHPDGQFCTYWGNPDIGGYRNFDNILYAWIQVFQHVAMQDWSFIMYNTQEAASWWTWLLHITMVLFGGYLIVNLTIAVIFINFSKNYSAATTTAGSQDAGGGQPDPLTPRSDSRAADSFLNGQLSDAPPPAPPQPVSQWSASRLRWEKFRDVCFLIQASKAFQHTTTFMIIVNAVVLALVWYEMPQSVIQATEAANYFFTMYFFVEMCTKLLGLGPRLYASDNFNVFDALVTMVGVIDMALSLAPGVNANGGAMSVFRAFRLMRIFRLARSWKSLNRIIKVLISAIAAVSWLTLLLLLFLFIVGLLGMALFGYRLDSCPQVPGAEQLCPPGLTFGDCPAHFDCYIRCNESLAFQWFSAPGSPYGDQAYCEMFPRQPADTISPPPPSLPASSTSATTPGAPYSNPPPSPGNSSATSLPISYWAQVGKADTMTVNYDDIFHGILSAFVILTADAYDTNMKQTMVLTNPWLACLFTIVTMVVGIFMVLNLFLAMLLNNLDQLDEEQADASISGRDREPRIHPVEDKPEHLMSRASLEEDEPKWAAPSRASREWTPPPKHPDDPNHTPQWPRSALKGPSKSKLMHDSVQSSQSFDYTNIRTPSHLHHGSSVVPLPPSLLVPLPSFGHEDEEQSPPHPVQPNTGLKPLDAVKRLDWAEPSEAASRAESCTSKVQGAGKSFTAKLRASANSVTAGHSDASVQRAATEREASCVSGTSLLLFSKTNRCRHLLCNVVTNKYFEFTMLFLIMLSSLALCIDDNSVEPGTMKWEVLHNLDIFFVVAFGLEAIMKIIVFGLLFNGPDSYMRSGWNLLDLFIVVVGILVLVLQSYVDSKNIIWLRAFRALRALRPLRVVTHMDGIRTVIHAIAMTIPAVAEVVLVASLFYFIFGVLGVNLLGGRLDFCADMDGNILDPYYLVGEDNINRSWCEDSAGSHVIDSSHYHEVLNVSVPSWSLNTTWGANGVLTRFDNVIMSIWVLLQMASLENWSAIMFQSMWITEENVQPVLGSNIYMAIFFLAFIIFCSFFILNMIIGVSIDKFNKLKKAKGGASILLTRGQEDWLTLQRMMASTAPKTKYPLPENTLRLWCFELVMSRAFDHFMVFAILSNVLTMFMTHEGMSSDWEDALKTCNVVYTGVFVVEMLLKWAAIGIKQYFKEGWLQFDFFVVVISVMGVIMDFATTQSLSIMPLLRVLRVLRIFKLIPKAKGLRMMMMTLLWSAPALMNVGTVLLMFMFIYAIVGMNFFGGVKLQSNLAYLANFQDFPTAMLLLFRMTTGENWNAVMWDCMQTNDCIFVKQDVNVTLPGSDVPVFIWQGTYLDSVSDADAISQIPQDAKDDQCSPAPAVAAIYFSTYMVIVVYLMVQLVIGIILENIELHSRIESMSISQEHIQSFVDAWEELDTEGCGFIKATHVTALLSAIDPPMGVRGLDNKAIRIQEIVYSLDIPLRNQSVHFLETLHSLVGRVAGADVPADEEFTIHNKMISRLPKDEIPPKFTVGDFYAAIYVKTSIQGFLIRDKLKPLFDLYEDDQATEGGDHAQPPSPWQREMALTAEEREELLKSPTLDLKYRRGLSMKVPAACPDSPLVDDVDEGDEDEDEDEEEQRASRGAAAGASGNRTFAAAGSMKHGAHTQELQALVAGPMQDLMTGLLHSPATQPGAAGAAQRGVAAGDTGPTAAAPPPAGDDAASMTSQVTSNPGSHLPAAASSVRNFNIRLPPLDSRLHDPAATAFADGVDGDAAAEEAGLELSPESPRSAAGAIGMEASESVSAPGGEEAAPEASAARNMPALEQSAAGTETSAPGLAAAGPDPGQPHAGLGASGPGQPGAGPDPEQAAAGPKASGPAQDAAAAAAAAGASAPEGTVAPVALAVAPEASAPE